jgi:hypothetical protein
VALVGETVIDAPLLPPETGDVHVELVYHFQIAPVPNGPPLTLRSVDPPEQILFGLAEALVGLAVAEFTVSFALALDILLPAELETTHKYEPASFDVTELIERLFVVVPI